MQYENIMWIEDFDDRDTEDIILDLDNEDAGKQYNYEKKKSRFFPNLYAPFVKVHTNFLAALQELEQRFEEYDCVVLDINLERGIADHEIVKIEEKLKLYRICRRKGSKEEDFKKNAGYYLYLYLLQRGFPSERIVMLTGNCGKGNTSEEWEKVFEDVGLVPPKAINKKECENNEKSDFVTWLENNYTLYYRLRSCVVAMSNCILEKLNEDDNIIFRKKYWKKPLLRERYKELISDLKLLPLSSVKEQEQAIYTRLVSRLTHDWELADKPRFFYPHNQVYGVCCQKEDCIIKVRYKEKVDRSFVCNDRQKGQGCRHISESDKCNNRNFCEHKKPLFICNNISEKKRCDSYEEYNNRCKKLGGCTFVENYKEKYDDLNYCCLYNKQCEYKYTLEDTAYHTVLKMTRNWIAHSKLKKLDVRQVAFLFGVGMRGLFDINDLQENHPYLNWEEKLLEVINYPEDDLDENAEFNRNIELNKENIEKLITQSCFSLYRRAEKLPNFSYTSNIGYLISTIGGEKSRGECYATDLLLAFLHSLFPINIIPKIDKNKLVGFDLTVSTELLEKRESAELKYVRSIYNKVKMIFLNDFINLSCNKVI